MHANCVYGGVCTTNPHILIIALPVYSEYMNTQNLSQLPEWAPIAIAAIAAWTLLWKGLALWRAAQNNSLTWFVVLLLVNTLGILEIFYIFVIAKNKANN